MYWNCFLPSVATDGMDGNGLKLEKNCQFFQVSAQHRIDPKQQNPRDTAPLKNAALGRWEWGANRKVYLQKMSINTLMV